jgi:hypothetical protein
MKNVQMNEKYWPFITPDNSNVLRSHMAKSYVDDLFLRFLVFIQVHRLGFEAETFRFLGFTASGVFATVGIFLHEL